MLNDSEYALNLLFQGCIFVVFDNLCGIVFPQATSQGMRCLDVIRS